MKKYRLLMHCRNFRIERDGKPKKCGFYQNFYLEADNLRQAELMVTTTILHDKELKAATLNEDRDPPKINLDTYWELNSFDYVGRHLETGRTFYEEKKWWQFWR